MRKALFVMVLSTFSVFAIHAQARAELPYLLELPFFYQPSNPSLVATAPCWPFLPRPCPMPSGLVLYDFFPRDTLDVQILGGAYFSPVGIGAEAPVYNFTPYALRVGVVTEYGCTQGPLRGSFEPLLELSGAPVFGGVGSFYIGPSLLLRYNFTQPGARVVPYFQVGAGITFNNGFQDPNQTSLGQEAEFLLQSQVGLHWFVTDRISFDVEGGLIHISNANTAVRNGGINALGVSLGLSFYFGGPRNGIHW